MGRMIPEAMLIILSIAAGSCQEPQLHGREDTIVSKTVIGRELRETERARTAYYLVEKKEVFEKAESLALKLKKQQDSLVKIPISERNVESFRDLNILTDKHSFLAASLKEAREASPQEWDFHHQKLKIIFKDIESYFSGKGDGGCSE